MGATGATGQRGTFIRYTATIVVVAIFLTAGLGFKMYQATREISRIILFTVRIMFALNAPQRPRLELMAIISTFFTGRAFAKTPPVLLSSVPATFSIISRSFAGD